MPVLATSPPVCPPLPSQASPPPAAATAPPRVVSQAQALAQADTFKHKTLNGAITGFSPGGGLGMMTALAGADAMGLGRIATQSVLIKALSFGMVAGAVSGAVAANLTTDRSKAATYGGLVGAGVGFAIGLPAGLKSAVVWSAWGAGSALAGAVGGSTVALKAEKAAQEH